MNTANILTIVAALSAGVVTTAAEARGGRGGGHGFRSSGIHFGGGHRFHGHRYHHRGIHVGFAYPSYDYCRWYRTPYGPVKRCLY